jgi:hypothetical protein
MLVVIATLLTTPARAPAQAQGSADAGLETYQLTMPNIRKMAAAYEKLDAALAANPALAHKLESDEAATSTANVIAKLEGEPVVRQALAAAGITARDFVLTQFATFAAGMTEFAVRAGAPSPTAPAAAANLRLYQQNRAELEQITARLKELASWQALQAGDKSDDEDQE